MPRMPSEDDGAEVSQDLPLKEFEAAMEELSSELGRLNHNVQGLAEYQKSVFEVTKVLCAWMNNIEAMARHRSQLPVTYDPAE